MVAAEHSPGAEPTPPSAAEAGEANTAPKATTGRVAVTCGEQPPDDSVEWSIVPITRPSALGNPFLVRGNDKRKQVVKAHKAWVETGADPEAIAAEHGLMHAPRLRGAAAASQHRHLHAALAQLRTRLHAGENLALSCACSPKACHGNVYVAMLQGEPPPDGPPERAQQHAAQWLGTHGANLLQQATDAALAGITSRALAAAKPTPAPPIPPAPPQHAAGRLTLERTDSG